jgi:hypothetical protein
MHFLTPLYLAGTALVALPVVLHLLRRDVAPRVPFTAVRLLRRTTVERSRRHRLRDLLLLAARVAALVLLAGSFARPYLGAAQGTGRATVVAIDRSYSMAAPGVFEAAVRLARAAIEGSGGRVALVAFDDRADLLAPLGSAADARDALAGVRPGDGATRYAAALDKAADVLRGEPAGRLVLVSDLQRSGFDGSAAALPLAVALELREARGPASNLAVTDVRLDDGTAIAVVRNYGATEAAAEVRADAAGRRLAATRVTIPPAGAVDVPLPAADASAGLEVSVDDAGGYPADNHRFAMAVPRVLPRVLVAGGGPVAEAGYYFSRALLASDASGPAFDVRTLTGSALASLSADELKQASVVALLSTHGLDRRAKDTLRAFLDAGGGLFIAAAPDLDPSVLSALLDWQPALAPREVTDAGVLTVSELRHPIFRPFDPVSANFAQVAFHRAWDIHADPPWRVLARYSDGAVALAERTAGHGRLLLFTSDLDHRWNDFPLHPSFVPFVQEAVRYLGARPPARMAFTVGEVPAGVPATPGIVNAGGRAIVVNADVRESSVDRLSPDAFVKQVARTSGGAPDGAASSRAGLVQIEARQAYWRYGLLLMMAALVGEAFVGSRT